MKEVNRILVGVDFSECSITALQTAEWIRKWNGGDLTALHIIDHEVFEDINKHTTIYQQDVISEAETRLKEFVDKTFHKRNNGNHTECLARIGHPFADMVSAVNELKIDLLVLGMHGSGKHPDRVGVIASKCIRKAPSEVMLVRHDLKTPLKKIAVCVDLSEVSKKVFEEAITLAKQNQTELTMIYVNYPLWAYHTTYIGGASAPFVPPVEHFEDKLEKSIDAFLNPFCDELQQIQFKKEILESTTAGPAIIEYLKKYQPNLVVMGTRGRTGLKTLLMGTTAEHILKELPCSVLAIKSENFKFNVRAKE